MSGQPQSWESYLRGRVANLERENKDLRGANDHLPYLYKQIEDLRRENERLRWFYENMRMADRMNLEMEYEAERK